MKRSYPQLSQGGERNRGQGNGRNQNQQGTGNRGQGFQPRQFVQSVQGAVNAAYHAGHVAYQPQQAFIPAVAPQPGV